VNNNKCNDCWQGRYFRWGGGGRIVRLVCVYGVDVSSHVLMGQKDGLSSLQSQLFRLGRFLYLAPPQVKKYVEKLR